MSEPPADDKPPPEPTQAPWGAPPPGPPPPPPPPVWSSGPPAYPPPGPPAYPPYPGGPPGPQRRGSRGTRVAVAVVAGVLVVALAVVVPLVVFGSDDSDGGEADDPRPSDDTSQTTDGPDPAPAPTDLGEVQVIDDLATTHVTEAVVYEQTPPAGGPHFDEWLECGVYDAPVPDENAVHDLEHGTVWITYDPDLDEADVEALAAELPQNGIMSPYDGLPAPVVVTVWERQLALTGADDPRLPLFVEEFDDGVTAPEPYASCAGGTAEGSRSS